MNELAVELNRTLENSIAYGFLSELGKRMYFPKGITAQSAEAGERAKRHNATVGLATTNGQPFCLSDIYNVFKEGIFKPSDLFNYAPGGGDKSLRAHWQARMFRKNPSLQNAKVSFPLVTGGLTHTISIVAQLFVGAGQEVVCPNLFWDNYELIFTDLVGAKLRLFQFYNAEGGFNVEGMKEALLAVPGDYARIILNFPNNPTGYTPSKTEAEAIVEAVKEVADTGKKVMVISDDAYFGLFFEEETEKESLFAKFAIAHPNIFAIKGDAATKEEMVWGFRIGFITYASKDFTDAHMAALENKTLGAIRCTVSNCDRPGQSMLLKAMRNGPNYQADKDALQAEMQKRYNLVHAAVERHKGDKFLTPYPFNSGYFMAFNLNGRSADALRRYLLDEYEVGVINILGHTLRLAYCSVECEAIDDLVDTVYKAAAELWG